MLLDLITVAQEIYSLDEKDTGIPNIPTAW